MAFQILDLANDNSDPGPIFVLIRMAPWVPGLGGNAAFARDDVFVCLYAKDRNSDRMTCLRSRLSGSALRIMLSA